MDQVARSPYIVSTLSFVVLLVSVRIGLYFQTKPWRLKEDERRDFDIVMTSSLTLLGLIIGFSFSMALARYDLRKSCEANEANAIGTEYLRVELLAASDAARVRELLKEYLDQRILYYVTRDDGQIAGINASTARLQSELWSAIQGSVVARPDPVAALVAAGMNDVLNTEGYTQAAWWNQIPSGAWVLMLAIAICCNLMIGYSARGTEVRTTLFFIVPLLVAISFLLMSDLDSPRGGIIRVHPQNLLRVSQSWR